MENLKEAVLSVVRDVARDRAPELESVGLEQLLVEDLGLKSLDLARIVAKLEILTGVDPFAELVAITSIRTAGDLYAAYARCFSAEAETASEAAPSESEPAGARAAAGLASQRERRKQAREERSS